MSEVTAVGVSHIIKGYIQGTYPNTESMSFDIVKIGSEPKNQPRAYYGTTYTPPRKGQFKLIFIILKEVDGKEIKLQSEYTAIASRSTAITASDLGRMLGSMKEVENV